MLTRFVKQQLFLQLNRFAVVKIIVPQLLNYIPEKRKIPFIIIHRKHRRLTKFRNEHHVRRRTYYRLVLVPVMTNRSQSSRISRLSSVPNIQVFVRNRGSGLNMVYLKNFGKDVLYFTVSVREYNGTHYLLMQVMLKIFEAAWSPPTRQEDVTYWVVILPIEVEIHPKLAH